MSDHVKMIVERLERLSQRARRQEERTHKYEVRLRSQGRRKAYDRAAKLVKGILTRE